MTTERTVFDIIKKQKMRRFGAFFII